ncbi:MAG: M56 family metallopeptidase, partial [Gemmataceae bacterium]
MAWLLHLGLNNAALAALLAGPALFASRWLRRPALAHALWLLVLLKLVTPSFVPLRILPPPAEEATPVVLESRPVPVVPARHAVAQPKPKEPARPMNPFDMLPPEVKMVLPPLPEEPLAQDDSLVEEEDWLPPPATAEPEPTTAPSSPRVNAAFNPTNSLAAIWLAGSGVWLGLAFARVRRFRRLLWDAEAAPASLVEEVSRLAGRLGLRRPPAVFLIPGPIAPLIWAAGGRPRLYYPKGLLDRLTDRGRETLLVHELAHLKRGDHWVRWL